MTWLQHKEYVPYAPEEVGTVHKHHCKDGKDNDKLFITRCEDGYTILAYCHHCGKRGRFDSLKHSTIQQIKSIAIYGKSCSKISATGRPRIKYKLPKDYERDYKKWGSGAYVWLRRYGITDEEIKSNNIGYSELYGRVILPMFGKKGIDFVVMRRVNSMDNDSPKYLTFSNVEHPLYITQSATALGALTDTVVLTEDILSAIKVARYVPSIALLGTSINERTLEYVSRYNNVIIFMDDDNQQVRNSQLRIKNRLEPFVDSSTIIHSGGIDPKEMSDKKLKEILGYEETK